jgi:hypothetical protein
MRHADVFQFHMHSIEKCHETDRIQTGLPMMMTTMAEVNNMTYVLDDDLHAYVEPNYLPIGIMYDHMPSTRRMGTCTLKQSQDPGILP